MTHIKLSKLPKGEDKMQTQPAAADHCTRLVFFSISRANPVMERSSHTPTAHSYPVGGTLLGLDPGLQVSTRETHSSTDGSRAYTVKPEILRRNSQPRFRGLGSGFTTVHSTRDVHFFSHFSLMCCPSTPHNRQEFNEKGLAFRVRRDDDG